MVSISHRPKPSKYRIRGTLATRILIITLLLLAFPLLVHTLFMYENEHEKAERDLVEELSLIARGESLYLEQYIHTRYNFLDIVSANLPLESDAGLNQFFSMWDEVFSPSSLLYLQMQGEKLLVIASSISEKIGENFSFVKQELFKKKFVFLQEDTFLIAVSIFDPSTDLPIGALVAITPVSTLLKRFGKAPYPINISLEDTDRIVASTNDRLIGKKAVFTPLIDIKDGYELNSEGYATFLPLDKFQLIVDVSKKRITEVGREKVLFHLFTFLFLVVVLGGGLVAALTVRLNRPLRNIFRVIDRIFNGELDARYQKDPFGFEINIIGRHLNEMMDAIVLHKEREQSEKTQKEKLEKELLIGRQIQKQMFPLHLPELSHVDIGAGYMPAKEVGGDFYDAYLHDGRLFLVIADTAGKGISACLYSLGMRSLLRAYATIYHSLSDILQFSNHLFAKDAGETGMFITTWVGILENRTLTYCSAGHFPAFLRKETKEIFSLNTPGIALGAQPWIDIYPKRVLLDPGDVLLLYTDGIVEAQNINKEMFGVQRLEKFLINSEERSARHIASNLLEEVKNFSGNRPLEDDQTVLVICVKDG